MKNVLIHAAAGVEMKEDSAVSHGHTLEKKFSKRRKEQIHPQAQPQWDERGRVSELFHR